ncbi:MAG: MarR family winged helix-turn-helix transcriptional regulator [Gammaproteobacteria bacterium]
MTKRTQEGELLTGLILETFRLNGSLLDAGNQITKPYGLTSARWQVMGAIDLEGRSITVSQIARRMGLTRQAVQRIVNDLVKLGMIEVKPNVDHKRASLVSISKSGAVAMDKINKAQIAWVNQLSDGLSERQLNQALRLLERVKTRCDELPINNKKEK